MTTTIIKTDVTQTVTLGSLLYAAQLTITSTGVVSPASSGASAVFGNGSGELVENVGNLVGGTGTALHGGNGGIGVELVFAGTVFNKGTILGGAGGSGSRPGVDGGDGGAAIYLVHDGRASNSGSIAGGSGAIGTQYGGLGGIGVRLGTVGTFKNTAWVSGGIGGYGTVGGGGGGAGVYLLDGDSFNNSGPVSGGGGGGTRGAFAGDGGNGVHGVASTLANSSTISGGLGGNAVSYGGEGGIGLYLDGGSLSNSGSILGGTGGVGTGSGNGNGYGYGYGGRGGIGLYVTGFGTAANSGLIEGGSAGAGVQDPSDGGTGTELSGSGTLSNSGSIAGGTGFAAHGGLGSQQGGAGGVGVALSGSATAANSGTIAGGLGGNGGGYYGGTGGAGATMAAGGTLSNSGAILGGAGGEGYSGGTGGVGIDLAGSAISLATNSGVISGGAGGDGSGGYGGNGGAGVELVGGGTFTNQIGGVIAGGVGGYGNLFGGGTGGIGVDIADGGTVTNYGAIYGGTGGNGGGLGALLNAGTLTNNGTICGGGSGTGSLDGAGVYVFSGTLANNGVISGGVGGFGVYLAAGDLLTNASDATIGGAVGLAAVGMAGSTLENAGTIIGSQGTAVYFGSEGRNLLVLEPGFAFSGLVTAASTATNVVELASTGGPPGTLTSLGGQFINFDSITFDPGADWFISGNRSGLTGTISGFAVGDTIELTGVTATRSSYADGILTLHEAHGSATLDLPGFTAGQLVVTDVSGGTEVTVACFRDGTGIMTERGEVSVERLQVGDLVRAHAGDGRAASRPIAWVGHRRIECCTHKCPRNVWPVRVLPDAFGPGQPARSLWLSPDHAVFIDGFLIPVRHLINGSLVTQEEVDNVTFHHVELASHSILLAEGLSCESYLDTGNRAIFENGPLVPSVGRDAEHTWARHGCAPLLEDGPRLAEMRARLAQRATRMGYGRPPIRDVCLSSVGTAGMVLPSDAQGVRLVSKSQRSGTDRRRLGALLAGFRIEGNHYGVADIRLGLGFHEIEHHGQAAARWTDGDALIDIGRATTARHLEVDIVALKVELDQPQEV